KEDFTVVEFLNRLDKAFGDPEKITKAIDKLNSIQQGNRGFRDFLQDFEQSLLEAQAWDWSDEAKKGYLRSGLNRDLTDQLVSQAELHAYDDFVSQLRMTSDKMEGMKSWDKRRNRNRSFNSQPPASADIENNGDPMDWEPTPPVNIAAVQRASMGRQQNARATWVSHDEIGRRISAGLCIRCGRRGHIIKDCAMLPAINPNRQEKGKPANLQTS
ncbi:hypothetical protein K3495_g16976, partial [Podosphaera aphanis]